MILREAVAILERTPSVLEVWLEGLSDEWINCNTGPGTFSPFDVVGHLIHGEKTDWIPRLRIILDHGTSRPFDPFDRFAMYEASKGKTLPMLLVEFAGLRRESLSELKQLNLSEGDMKREGIHPEFGRVTASQLLATWVAHDLNHIDQIARTMAHRYDNDVGPWRKYLAILTR